MFMIRRLLFKGVAFVGAILLIALILIETDGAVIAHLADANLAFVKGATRVLPTSISYRVEVALRLFGIDRALLLAEAAAVIKIGMLAMRHLFRRRRRRNGNGANAPPAATRDSAA